MTILLIPIDPITSGVSEAYSNLGVLFGTVLKLRSKAHSFYLECILYADIVTHITGAVFFNKVWYQRAKQAVEEDRLRNIAFDANAVAAEREPTLLKVKPQLDDIAKVLSGFESIAYKAYALLGHLQKNIPSDPPTEIAPDALDKNDRKAMKKAIMKAITVYHTDKAGNKRKGMEWQVLCEEITKQLNGFYENFKGD